MPADTSRPTGPRSFFRSAPGSPRGRRWLTTVAVLAPMMLVPTLTGCAAVEPVAVAAPAASSAGTAISTAPISSTPPPTSTPACDDHTIADPWIAFESQLHDGSVIAVGDRGWLASGISAADVVATGDVGSVRLVDGSAVTELRCGVVISRASWVEVHGIAVGRVTLTYRSKQVTVQIRTG